jgi:hypothetical protein
METGYARSSRRPGKSGSCWTRPLGPRGSRHTLLDEEWRDRETGYTDVDANAHMFVNHYSISTGMMSSIVPVWARSTRARTRTARAASSASMGRPSPSSTSHGPCPTSRRSTDSESGERLRNAPPNKPMKLTVAFGARSLSAIRSAASIQEGYDDQSSAST